MQELEKIRQQIDRIDSQISKLLRQRAQHVGKIKEIKKNFKIKTRDQKRENEILTKLESEYEKMIFKKILSASRKLQNN